MPTNRYMENTTVFEFLTSFEKKKLKMYKIQVMANAKFCLQPHMRFIVRARARLFVLSYLFALLGNNNHVGDED